MGRLADTFQGRKIMQRTPYIMASSVNIASSRTGIQFPSAGFLHTNDKPFEIHRMIPVVLLVDVTDPTQVVAPWVGGQEFISCRVLDFGKNVELTKASTPLATLVKSQTEKIWEWTDPHTLVKTEGFTVTVDSDVFDDSASICRVQIAFQGYLLTLPADRK